MAEVVSENFDVVIIGAGPGGLNAAKTLGGSDKKVLIIDRKEVIGPKTCAGGLTEWDKEFDLPEDRVRDFERQYFEVGGKKFYADYPISTVDRGDLGQFQLKQLEQYNNIEVRNKTTAKEVHEDYILINENKETKKIFYKYLIDADGSTSMVRRFLRLENRLFQGMQYIIPDMDYKEFLWVIDFDKMKTSYVWIFPLKDKLSAGIYYNPKLITSSKKAREILNDYLDKFGVDYSKGKIEGMPVNCLYQGHHFGNKYLVGEAAGLTSAPTGEGIAFAMTSSVDVAKHILDENYNFEKLKEILKYKKYQERLLWLFDTFPFLQKPFFNYFLKKYFMTSK
jgi:flavin-dependent dehydrogenase